MPIRLTAHDLKQIDGKYLATLSPEQLLHLSEKMLDDLREARDLLNQTPWNSSRPSGSYAPWEQAGFADEGRRADAAEEQEEEKISKRKGQKDDRPSPPSASDKRRAGKQVGARGVGRQVTLPVTGEEVHRPSECAACGESFREDTPFQATTGFYVLDIEQKTQGIEVTHVKHIYGECSCDCGHVTAERPGRSAEEPGWSVSLTEWRLVGPTLASLIICLSLRMRLSRRRIREFLQDWLGIALSVGCINQCITEGGRAASALEEEFIAESLFEYSGSEIQQAGLLYADETGWKENGRLPWLPA